MTDYLGCDPKPSLEDDLAKKETIRTNKIILISFAVYWLIILLMYITYQLKYSE